jgi:hypothetical protein
MHGWKILTRTVNIAANYQVKEWIRFTGTGGEMNINGIIYEFAYPQGNQTEMTYKETSVGVWLRPDYPAYELRSYDTIFYMGSPYTQTQGPSGGTTTGPNTSWIGFNAKSKDYATSHTMTIKAYCNDWSRITITYP